MLPEGLSPCCSHTLPNHMHTQPLCKNKVKNGIRGFKFLLKMSNTAFRWYSASQRLERPDCADFICVTSCELLVRQCSNENISTFLFWFSFNPSHYYKITNMLLVCFEVFLCHPCSNHTKSGIVVTPEAVAWDNRTGRVWPQRGSWQRNIIAPNKAPEHVVSRSAVLLLSDRVDHKVMWVIKAKAWCWRLSERLHWFNVLSSFLSNIWLGLDFHHNGWFGLNSSFE